MSSSSSVQEQMKRSEVNLEHALRKKKSLENVEYKMLDEC